MSHISLGSSPGNDLEPEQKPKDFVEYKADENFNHMHLFNIQRIKIYDFRSNIN